MNYIEDYVNERNKTGKVITYQEYLEHRLTDAEEKTKQLIEFSRKLAESQKEMPADFKEVIDKDFWDII